MEPHRTPTLVGASGTYTMSLGSNIRPLKDQTPFPPTAARARRLQTTDICRKPLQLEPPPPCHLQGHRAASQARWCGLKRSPTEEDRGDHYMHVPQHGPNSSTPVANDAIAVALCLCATHYIGSRRVLQTTEEETAPAHNVGHPANILAIVGARKCGRG